MRKFSLLLLLIVIGSSSSSFASRKGKNLALDLVGGLPQLFGLELRYIALEKFTFGASFGSAPINGVLQSRIEFNDIPLQNTSGFPDPLTLLPSATYSLTGFTLFGRYYPWVEGWFTQLGYSRWGFSGTVTGDLRNETTSGIANAAVTGTIDITQQIVSVTIGRQWFISDFFFEFGLGAGYLIPLKYSISTGGAANTFSAVAPGDISADLDQARADLEARAESELDKIKDQLKVIPLIFISVGWTF